MKKLIALAVLSLIAFTSSKLSAQIEKGDVHIGIAGLPIVDLFNIYPDNKINGLGLTGQVGFFPHKNIYLGINPYYVKVKNRYPDSGSMTDETIKVYGINTALSYYVGLTSKFYIYAGLSAGVGAADHQRSNNAVGYISSQTTYPIFTVAPGIGLHYFITEKMTLNLNLPLLNIKYISYSKDEESFRTIAPTIGVGFFF
ncbi:MAG TPA: outer membrane beta-barrel protein [Cytophagaceae bacterium]